jgi:hypothetical protein
MESKDKLKYYHYGYRRILPSDKEEVWDYTVQMHKNQNGTHFDLRLARPGEGVAYSWAVKKPPLPGVKPLLAMRTHDHSLDHMKFEGALTTAKGYGTVKILENGKIQILSIDDKGITFKKKDNTYRLRPAGGKKYMFEQVLY